MISRFDLATTVPDWALGYRFDIVLRWPRGHADGGLTVASLGTTPSQTVGPFFEFGLVEPQGFTAAAVDPGRPAR